LLIAAGLSVVFLAQVGLKRFSFVCRGRNPFGVRQRGWRFPVARRVAALHATFV